MMDWLSYPPPRGWLTAFTVIVFLFLVVLIEVWTRSTKRASKRLEAARHERPPPGPRPSR